MAALFRGLHGGEISHGTVVLEMPQMEENQGTVQCLDFQMMTRLESGLLLIVGQTQMDVTLFVKRVSEYKSTSVAPYIFVRFLVDAYPSS